MNADDAKRLLRLAEHDPSVFAAILSYASLLHTLYAAERADSEHARQELGQALTALDLIPEDREIAERIANTLPSTARKHLAPSAPLDPERKAWETERKTLTRDLEAAQNATRTSQAQLAAKHAELQAAKAIIAVNVTAGT